MTQARRPRRKSEPATPAEPRPDKIPFDVSKADRLMRKATAPYPKAALFELAAEGHDSVFEILTACIISIRTRDETTLPVSKRLFGRASTPAAVVKLSVEELDELIRPCTFHEPKAATIHAIARQAVERHGGELPCDADALMQFRGVGPKCAHLAVGIVCGQPLLGVDVHVHRVTNRWGIIREKTPEKSMAALMKKLPKRYWVEINALLVPFGKHVCTGSRPKCSTCPLLAMCQQVGVVNPR